MTEITEELTDDRGRLPLGAAFPCLFPFAEGGHNHCLDSKFALLLKWIKQYAGGVLLENDDLLLYLYMVESRLMLQSLTKRLNQLPTWLTLEEKISIGEQHIRSQPRLTVLDTDIKGEFEGLSSLLGPPVFFIELFGFRKRSKNLLKSPNSVKFGNRSTLIVRGTDILSARSKTITCRNVISALLETLFSLGQPNGLFGVTQGILGKIRHTQSNATSFVFYVWVERSTMDTSVLEYASTENNKRNHLCSVARMNDYGHTLSECWDEDLCITVLTPDLSDTNQKCLESFTDSTQCDWKNIFYSTFGTAALPAALSTNDIVLQLARMSISSQDISPVIAFNSLMLFASVISFHVFIDIDCKTLLDFIYQYILSPNYDIQTANHKPTILKDTHRAVNDYMNRPNDANETAYLQYVMQNQSPDDCKCMPRFINYPDMTETLRDIWDLFLFTPFRDLHQLSYLAKVRKNIDI